MTMRIPSTLAQLFAIVSIHLLVRCEDDADYNVSVQDFIVAKCNIDEIHIHVKVESDDYRTLHADVHSKESSTWSVNERYQLTCTSDMESMDETSIIVHTRKPLEQLSATQLITATYGNNTSVDWYVRIAQAPYLHYNEEVTSMHTLRAAVTTMSNTTFTMKINHTNIKSTWQELQLNTESMPFYIRYLTWFSSLHVPSRLRYVRASLPLTENIKARQWPLLPDTKVLFSHEGDPLLTEALNQIRTSVSSEVPPCNDIQCSDDISDNACLCTKQTHLVRIQDVLNVHAIMWYAPGINYSLPTCLFKCVYDQRTRPDTIQEELEFYTSWSGYFKQLWKYPQVYKGHIFGSYFVVILIHQAVNIAVQSVYVRIGSFFATVILYGITVSRLIPILLCEQVASLHYIINLDVSCDTKFWLRLYQFAALNVTFFHPCVLVTIMLIPVCFYLSDLIETGHFRLNYFKKMKPKTLPSYKTTACDEEMLQESSNYAKVPIEDAITPEKTHQSPKDRQILDSDSKHINPVHQILNGIFVTLNLVIIGFICVLCYLLL